MVGRRLQRLGMFVQIYVAVLCGLVGMTKQVLFLIEAAGVFAGGRRHEEVQIDVLPRKLAFCRSDKAVPDSGAREDQGRQARSLRSRPADLRAIKQDSDFSPGWYLNLEYKSFTARLFVGFIRRDSGDHRGRAWPWGRFVSLASS